jgi:hypothetical protein
LGFFYYAGDAGIVMLIIGFTDGSQGGLVLVLLDSQNSLQKLASKMDFLKFGGADVHI